MSDLINHVADKCRSEVERLIKGINEIKNDSDLHIIRGGSTGGYIAGLFYGFYIYRYITFKENFPKILDKAYTDLSTEFAALVDVMDSKLRFYEPLKWFMIGFLSALEDLKKEAEEK